MAKNILVKVIPKLFLSTLLFIIFLIPLLPIFVFFYIYRLVIYTILRIQIGSKFWGLLSGFDVLFSMEGPSKHIICILITAKTDETFEDFLQKFREYVKRKIFQNPQQFSKLLATRHQAFGFYYLIKDQVIIEDCVRTLKVESLNEEISREELLTQLDNSFSDPLPYNHSCLWEFLVCEKPFKCNKLDKTEKSYAILARIHHSAGDGMSLLKCFFDTNYADSNQDQNNSAENLVFRVFTKLQSIFMSIFFVLMTPLTIFIKRSARKPEKSSLDSTGLMKENFLVENVEESSECLKIIKDIKKKHSNTTFSDVLIAAVSRSFSNYFQKNNEDSNLTSIIASITGTPRISKLSLAKFKSPQLSNSFSFMDLNLPIIFTEDKHVQYKSYMQTLEVSKKAFENAKNSYDLQASSIFFKFTCSLFPTWMIPRILGGPQLKTLFITNVPGPSLTSVWDGCLIEDITVWIPVIGITENYGQSGIQAFRELAEEVDVCIAREDSVLSNAPNEVFDKVVSNLMVDPNARVVVCFCEGLTVRGLLMATRRLNISNHFLFIGSDGWADRGDVTRDYEVEAWGGISIRIHSPYVYDFDPYYKTLRPSTNIRNPWFKELWDDRFPCSLNISEKPLCTGEELATQGFRQDPKLSFVIKAVYTFAYALHNMHQELCGEGNPGVCDKLVPFNGSLFKGYLMNVSFIYDDEIVEFDENGDPPGRYDIINYQKLEDGSYDYVPIGVWNNRSLVWISDFQFGPTNFVKSVCSAPCHNGHYKQVQQGGKDKRCCWVCVRCPYGEILNASSDYENCKKCPLGTVPDETQTVCLLLPIEYTQWLDTEAIISMSFATLGFLTTSFAFVVFVKYSDTPVVKSSTKELSYILLLGMMISHASIFAILAEPTVMTCTLVRFIPGFSFAMIYAALLTKTNRIARILAGSKKKFPTRKQLFMSATAQVMITCFLIGIEIFISVGMLFYQPPNKTLTYFSHRTVLECDTTPEGVIVPLAFDFLLIMLCTVYAVKTRNVPENFNEAKFIGFSMYTTCVIWIAFVPIYFGSDSKIITSCMCITFSAMVTWVFLFVPKLFIIIFRAEKNNRSFFTTSKNIRCHIGCRVSTAISEKSSINSWRNYSNNSSKEIDKQVKETPQKRTLSCQTGIELLQVLLDPANLMEIYSPARSLLPKITERNCCETDNCQLKKITIKLPKNVEISV